MHDQQIAETIERAISLHHELGADSDSLIYVLRGWWLHALQVLDRSPNREEPHRAVLRDYALEMARQERRRFPRLFDETCHAVGILLDDSPHPRYSCDDGYIKITIDEAKQQATIEDYEGVLATMPMDVSAIVDRLQQERQRLFERDFVGERFLRGLFRDYMAILKKEKRALGEPVPIRAITTRRGKNVTGFRVDEFSVDMGKLSQHGPHETEDGHRIKLLQTKDTRSGILFPREQGYIGYVQFERPRAPKSQDT